MLVVMGRDAGEEQVRAVIERVRELGYAAHPMPGANRTAIGITGNTGAIQESLIDVMPGVREVIRVTKPYKLVSRELKPDNTVFRAGSAEIGGRALVVMAGPCSVESERQILETARVVREAGAGMLRGGAFKPRTSPYAFQGLGKAGLKLLARAREETGLAVVTEAMDVEQVGMVEDFADMIQVGARNMQNYSLLRRVGRSSLPVLLKRGMSATLEELLLAAEYIMNEGNYQVALCERGIRSFTDFTRNVLDLSVAPAIKALSHLPVIVDPSHGTGRRDFVIPMARAAVAAGADGIMVEVHPDPAAALSDGAQALTPPLFTDLMDEIRQIAPIVGRTAAGGAPSLK